MARLTVIALAALLNIMTDKPQRMSIRKQLYSPVSPMLRWKGRFGEFDACISNVSLEGCFLNTQGEAEIGELISFKVNLPTDEVTEMRGRVVHRQERPVGFGLRFEGLSTAEQMFLKLLMADADNSVT
jgi:hypothetical protein